MENQLKNISNYLLAGILILILTSCQNNQSIDCENCYAISNTNIIDVENGLVKSNMILIIKDNYIFEIGKTASLEISKEIPVSMELINMSFPDCGICMLIILLIPLQDLWLSHFG